MYREIIRYKGGEKNKMAVFPGYYTGRDGVLTFKGGAVAIGEFAVDITRGVARHPRSNSYSDLKKAGKVEFAGSIKRMMIGGELLESLIGSGDPSSNASAGPVSVGAATTFTFVGKAETKDDVSSNVTITATNCFFTKGGFPVGGADTIIEESMSFVMEDEDAGLTTQHTTQA